MKKNIIANFIGRFWGILSNFLFVPLYIKFLGLESYSVISFALVLNGLMAMMDAGLTATLSREFASSNNSINDKLRTYKTLETCYLFISALVIFLLLFSSKFIALKWLNLENIQPAKVSLFLKIIGIEIGLRLLGKFYSGGFIGLEKQVKANMYLVFYGVIRNGLVLIPIFFSPSLTLFFLWQATTTFFYVIVLRFDLNLTLTNSIHFFFTKPKIEKQVLIKIWKFAGGMMLISMVAGLNSQMDKLALSKLLPIEILGLYTLAFALSRGLNFISSPISTAILPRMTTLFTAEKKGDAIRIFNLGYLFVSIVIFSFASVLAFYAEELILIWTNDAQLAEKSYEYVPWITAGTSFLALQNLPFNVAIANGYTRFNNILGISSLLITLPGYWISTKLYGGVGAAITYASVQIVITIVFLFLVNRKFLGLTLKSLYLKNFLIPIVISFVVVYICKTIINVDGNRFSNLVVIGLVVFASIITNTIFLIPLKEIYKAYGNMINKLKKKLI